MRWHECVLHYFKHRTPLLGTEGDSTVLCSFVYCVVFIIVVVVDVVGAVVGHVLVALDQGPTVAAALEDHEADRDLLARDLAVDLVANQHQEIGQNPGRDLESVPEIGQNLDQGKDLEKGQGKGHAVVQVAL